MGAGVRLRVCVCVCLRVFVCVCGECMSVHMGVRLCVGGWVGVVAGDCMWYLGLLAQWDDELELAKSVDRLLTPIFPAC